MKDPSDVYLMVVADRITSSFLAQVELCGAAFVDVEPGIWRGSCGGFTLHGVETRKAYARSRSEHLLYTFSRAYLDNPEGVRPLDAEDFVVYHWLYQQVEQFKRTRGAMAVKDIELIEKSYQQVLEAMLKELPVEARLAGLTPEQVVSHYAPEELLARLTPEQVVSHYTPEELLAGLTPEQRAQLKRLLH